MAARHRFPRLEMVYLGKGKRRQPDAWERFPGGPALGAFVPELDTRHRSRAHTIPPQGGRAALFSPGLGGAGMRTHGENFWGIFGGSKRDFPGIV